MSKDRKLYACFVDFRKAFDSIDHIFLMYKLQKFSMETNAYGVLKDLYVNQSSWLSVHSDSKLSGFSPVQSWSEQGDPLSPTLLKIFINDILT